MWNVKMFKERLVTIRRKHLTDSLIILENITQNTGSTMVRNLKPERWCSLLVQEKYVNQKEKACVKRQNNNNNNNNKPVFVLLSADHDLKVKIIEFWERQDIPYCVGSKDGKHARKFVQAQVAPS